MQVDITWEVAGLTLLFAMVGLSAVILLTRLNGLRSFAKFAGFDFATTIAVGSVLAGIAYGGIPLVQGLVGLVGLFVTQRLFLIARNSGLSKLIDNDPLLLMRGGEVLWDNMARGRVSAGDLRGKLREANVLDVSQIRAVVLEDTGDISVLHGDADGTPLDHGLLTGVAGMDGGGPLPAAWHDGPGIGTPPT